MASNAATLRREGDTLVLAGVIDRAAAIALWPSASQQLAGARTLDLSAVTGLDSAGLALLAELAAQLRTFTGDGTTLPLPVPAELATVSTADVDGTVSRLAAALDRAFGLARTLGADTEVLHGSNIADALLARGLRLPGGDETMAWAVVGEDGEILLNSVKKDRSKAERYIFDASERLVRVAIRVVEGGDDAA